MNGKMTPKVSVIIPVFNVEKYINACLDSAVNQTLKEIEIICVDDGSTDNSLRIIDSYAEKDTRVLVLTQKSRGVSAARNVGVQAASGEYLYFLDSDDYLETDALSYLYTEAKENQLDILYFDGESFYESDAIKTQVGNVDVCYRPQEYGDIYSGEELYVRMRKDDVFRTMIWTMLIRADYYRNVQLSFYEGILHEDVLFTLQCVLNAERVSHRKKVFYHYRRRAGSITTDDVPMKRLHGKLVVMVNLVRFMQKRKFHVETYQYMRYYLSWLWDAMKEEYCSLTWDAKTELSSWVLQENFSVQMIHDILKKESEYSLSGNNNVPRNKFEKLNRYLKMHGVRATIGKIIEKVFR